MSDIGSIPSPAAYTPRVWLWLKDELKKMMGSNDLDLSDGCGLCGSLKIEWLCIMCDRHICNACKESHYPEHVAQPMLSVAMMGSSALHSYIEKLHRKKMERIQLLEQYRLSAMSEIDKEDETTAKLLQRFKDEELVKGFTQCKKLDTLSEEDLVQMAQLAISEKLVDELEKTRPTCNCRDHKCDKKDKCSRWLNPPVKPRDPISSDCTNAFDARYWQHK